MSDPRHAGEVWMMNRGSGVYLLLEKVDEKYHFEWRTLTLIADEDEWHESAGKIRMIADSWLRDHTKRAE
jgi:hypothetical protein